MKVQNGQLVGGPTFASKSSAARRCQWPVPGTQQAHGVPDRARPDHECFGTVGCRGGRLAVRARTMQSIEPTAPPNRTPNVGGFVADHRMKLPKPVESVISIVGP